MSAVWSHKSECPSCLVCSVFEAVISRQCIVYPSELVPKNPMLIENALDLVSSIVLTSNESPWSNIVVNFLTDDNFC